MSAKRLGPYVVVSEIGRGGMGAVYRARHAETGAEYALKTVIDHYGFGLTDEDVARFRREAELLARMEGHPGIVRVFGFGAEGGTLYIVMELVAGESLRRRLERGPLDPTEAARIVAEVADAIDHVHRHGALHRDLKPDNVVIDERGRPRVLDFGLALDAAAVTRLTASGVTMGTPEYMAPEQVDPRAAGGEVGPPTDVHALGALLYALLTGGPPFGGQSNRRAVLFDVLTVDPIPPRRHRAEIPAPLETICLHAMEKTPSDRYPSAAELAADLRRFLAEEPVLTGSRISGVGRIWRRVRPRARTTRMALGAAATVAAAVVVLTSLLAGVRWLLAEPAGARLERLEAELERDGRLGLDSDATLAALIAEDRAHPPAVRRRLARLDLLARAASGEATPAEAEALARMVRPDGELDRPGLLRVASTLHRAGRIAELDAVLHRVEPRAVCEPEHATALARAMIAEGSTLLPPTPSASFKALLGAPGLTDDERGRLIVRQGDRALAAGDRAGALDAYLEAFDRYGTVARRWTPEMHVAGLERFETIARRVLGADGADRGAPLEPLSLIADLLCRAPGSPPLEASLVVRLQGLIPGVRTFDFTTEQITLRVADARLLVSAVLSRYGALALSGSFGRDSLKAIGEDGIIAIGEGEMSKPPARRNLARIFLIGELLRDSARNRTKRREWLDALEAAGLDEAWTEMSIGLCYRRDGAHELARHHLERALELDRERPDAERWPRIIVELVTTLLVEKTFARTPELIDLAAELLLEATRVQRAVDERVLAIMAAEGFPSAELGQWGTLLDRITDVVRELLDRDDCCGADEGGRVGRLLELGLSEVLHDERIVAVTKLGSERNWFTIGSVHAARAEHHRKHGRLAAALDDLEAAEREELEIAPIGPDGKAEQLENVLAFRARRADLLDALGKTDDAAAVRAGSERMAAESRR